ncbi:hypothetical protein M501DRAFT_392646 [Patellaria atrata CBS 101060]|uniref:Uncharacterized protein n=1 Tax=Patellaria atrata CBS 101060 TaxID=1346257 RepID=A0A9P4SGM3_9PEZI|nr:hypothetical protein M501DRAFT_392646 [Patellaria atrata CBS 101060]
MVLIALMERELELGIMAFRGWVSETTSDYSSISSMISPPGTIPNLMFPPNPSLGNGLPDTKCSCLSNMFLTLSSLGSITSFTFPFVLPQLRAATATAREMVHCTECPKIPATGMQNTFFLGTLVTTIGERYRRVLQAIDEEAASLERAGTTKVFQIEDSSAETLHMHTGNSECGGRFTVDLEPREWQIIAKKVVKMDVLGSPDSKTTLLAVLKQTEDRQTEWHKSPEMDKKREELWGSETLANLHAHGPPDDGDHLCLRIVKQTRAILEAMPW